jgi:hypothetical protein
MLSKAQGKIRKMDTKIGGSKKKRAPAKRSKSKSRSTKTAKPKAKAKVKPRAKANPKPKAQKRAPSLTMAQLENAIRRKNQGDRTAFNNALAGVPMEEKQRFIRKRPLSAKATKALLFDLYGPPKPAPAPLPLNASPTRRLLFDIYGE